MLIPALLYHVLVSQLKVITSDKTSESPLID